MKPAADAIRLLYWKVSPNLEVGWVPASRVKVVCAGVPRGVLRIHSMSLRGRPVQAQTRCFISTWRVVSSLPSRKPG